jgi:hypothetical protein
MGPIRDLKGVQKVLGCLATLSRFISRLGEKGLPLYRLLKKHERFSWTVEAQEALDKLKIGAGAGLLFISPLGEHMRYAVRLHFPASNNMAEYEALLCGLRIAMRRASSAST